MSEDITRAEGGNMVGFAEGGLLIPYLRVHIWSKSASTELMIIFPWFTLERWYLIRVKAEWRESKVLDPVEGFLTQR